MFAYVLILIIVILKIYIKQGNVATHFRCGGYLVTMLLQVVYSERSLKIGQYLAKIMDSDKVSRFFETQCISSTSRSASGPGCFLISGIIRWQEITVMRRSRTADVDD